jgi:hypothetical protein
MVLGGFVFARLAMAEEPPKETSTAETPVQMIVTVEAKHGKQAPIIKEEDVQVLEGKERDEIKDWGPLQASQGNLELFILVDDATRTTAFGTQMRSLSDFISKQPANTAIGLGYMRDGTVTIKQNLTTDHAQAAKALRLPLGDAGASPSPYFSLTDLIKRWPQGNARREVLMITDGIDRFYGSGPSDPYVDQAISAAQRAGIVVFSIYSPGAGHFGHTFWRMNWGQIYLSQLSDETGGESYYLGTGAPVSFAPYLNDLAARLNRQYLLTFVPKTEKKSGERSVKVRTEVKNAELVSADRVYVPAAVSAAQ